MNAIASLCSGHTGLFLLRGRKSKASATVGDGQCWSSNTADLRTELHARRHARETDGSSVEQ
eukprot:1880631-Rhodomonas_salina.1